MFAELAKKTLTTIVASILTAAMTVLSATIHVAFAASTSSHLPPEYIEMLRLAEDKVRSATQPGAFGNGVPLLINVDPAGMISWIGLGIALGIGVIIAVKLFAPRAMNSMLLSAQ